MHALLAPHLDNALGFVLFLLLFFWLKGKPAAFRLKIAAVLAAFAATCWALLYFLA